MSILAGFTFDLTDPKNLSLADNYPSFEVLRSRNFNDTRDNSSLFGFKTDKDSGLWDTIFSAEIAASKNGTQRIYIITAVTCSNKKQEYGLSTIKTNGRNVRYRRYCDGSNIYITPLSKAGDAYLLNEFKKKNSVEFEFINIRVFFDATGFTKAWINFGGDAL
jgi:hypothetical protein